MGAGVVDQDVQPLCVGHDAGHRQLPTRRLGNVQLNTGGASGGFGRQGIGVCPIGPHSKPDPVPRRFSQKPRAKRNAARLKQKL